MPPLNFFKERKMKGIGLFTVKDILAGECGPVFMAVNHMVALRKFKNLLSKENIDPKEFKLMFVGEMNTESGFINTVGTPRVVELGEEEVAKMIDMEKKI